MHVLILTALIFLSGPAFAQDEVVPESVTAETIEAEPLDIAGAVTPDIVLSDLVEGPEKPVATGVTFEQIVSLLAMVIVPFLLGLARIVWKDKTDSRISKVNAAIGLAYGVTNEAAKLTKTKLDDKAAYALKVFRDALQANGVAPTQAEEKLAQLSWKSMHGQEKTPGTLPSPLMGSAPA